MSVVRRESSLQLISRGESWPVEDVVDRGFVVVAVRIFGVLGARESMRSAREEPVMGSAEGEGLTVLGVGKGGGAGHAGFPS